MHTEKLLSVFLNPRIANAIARDLCKCLNVFNIIYHIIYHV